MIPARRHRVATPLAPAVSRGHAVLMADLYEWRGTFVDAELEALHAEAFGHKPSEFNWGAQLRRHSLGWVCARRAGHLVGFVNVAWDGSSHAFIVDTVVAAAHRHRGLGTELLAVAVRQAKAAGCVWLHVDFEDHLGPFYFGSCGFTPAHAGLIRLIDE